MAVDPADYPETTRGYPYPTLINDGGSAANAATDVPADLKRLAEAVDADVAAVAAAQSGATADVASDLADHVADTTGVHGIADTSVLVTTARQITAGTGLTGGGTLAADRTIGIAAGGVGTTQLADEAVTSAKIADGTIATGDIANGAVTDAKLAGSIAPSKITGTAVVQARTITAGTGLTGGGDLSADRTIGIAAGGVGTTELANDAVTTGKIAAGAVGTTDIADSAVTSAKIADGTIVDADVNASAAIAPTKISGTAVVQARTITGVNSLTGGGDLSANRTLDVADLGIGTAELANNAVTTAKIADGAVTLGKLDPGASVVPAATVGNLLSESFARANTVTGITVSANATLGTTTADADEGTTSLLLTSAGAATAAFLLGGSTGATSQVYAVQPGAPYTVVFSAKSATGHTANSRSIVYWFTAAGAASSTPSTIIISTTALSSSWQRRSGVAVAPADAAWAVVLYGMTTAASGDGTYFNRLAFIKGACGAEAWSLPGVPIVGLGTRTNPADPTQVQIWNPGNATWITV